jgi:hypothetical protein
MSGVVKFVLAILLDKHSWGLGLEDQVVALEMGERVLTLKTRTETTPQTG